MELEIKEEHDVETPATPIPAYNVSEEEEEVSVDEQRDPEFTAPNPTSSESGLRRSTRNRQEPDRYIHNLTLLSTEQQDPSSVYEAKSSPDKDKWMKAMEKELESLQSNEVWRLVEPPSDRKIIGSKWVFKRKVDANGVVERYKAHLVAQGCTQRYRGYNFNRWMYLLPFSMES